MQVEAAERRQAENESRGIKDVDKVRRQQERAAQMEREELEAAKHGHAQPALRVNINECVFSQIFFLFVQSIYSS